jgi:2-hydroxy-6-oxonona-2,4-dienedioate hydrolase
MATAEITEEGTSRTVEAAGIRIHYHEVGEGDIPVIMLHGGGPGATGWSNYAPRTLRPIAERHRVILMDQPGFGGSDLPPADMPRGQFFVTCFLEFLDKLGIKKATLVGNSMGAGNAVNFTTAHEERVERLVLIGGIGGTNIISHEPTEGTKIIDEAYADPTLENFRRFFDMMLYDTSSIGDDVLQARVDAALERPHQLEARLEASRRFGMGVRRDNSEALSKMNVKTMVFFGRNDRVSTVEAALRAVTLIPDSRLVLFSHCAHWVQYERPEAFNGTLLEFLDES